MAMITVEAVDKTRLSDLDILFGSDDVADRCWCMWFIIAVKDFHAAGRNGNRASLARLATESPTPVGLIAYDDGAPAGWCAVGPRARYERALNTPTLKGRDPAEDSSVWLVPCFFVRGDARRRGVSTALLDAAVRLAADHGAAAIEGFPLAGTKTRSGGSDFMTGVEPLFASSGFVPVRRPSDNRVVMRRDLAT
jgi:GNAT superfamily N-acetyltransferase